PIHESKISAGEVDARSGMHLCNAEREHRDDPRPSWAEGSLFRCPHARRRLVFNKKESIFSQPERRVATANLPGLAGKLGNSGKMSFGCRKSLACRIHGRFAARPSPTSLAKGGSSRWHGQFCPCGAAGQKCPAHIQDRGTGNSARAGCPGRNARPTAERNDSGTPGGRTIFTSSPRQVP